MLGIPSTTDLALLGIALVAVGAGMLYERHEGAASVKTEDKSAALADAVRTHQIDQDTIDALRKQLLEVAGPTEPTGRAPPHIRVCPPSGVMPARGATSGPQPSAGPDQGRDRGVPAGVAAEVDAGPSLQDFALAGLFYLSDSAELFNRALKQADPSH